MKKFLCAALSAILLISLAGCGGSSQSGTPSPSAANTQSGSPTSSPTPDQAEQAELRFSWWGSDTRHDPYQVAMAKYMESNPDVKISGEFQGFDGYKQKILTQLAGGMEPDLMVLDGPWYPELTSKGDFFADLNETPGLFDFSHMDGQIVDDYGYYDGKLIAIPMGYNSRTVITNYTTAQKIGGLNYGERYTWDSLYEDGKKIHTEYPDIYLASPCPSELLIMTREILKQMTGNQLYSDNFERGYSENELLYAYEWIEKCYKDDVFQPLGDANLYEGKGEQNPLWVNGNVILSFQWTSGITRFKGTLPEGAQVDVIPYPQHQNQKDGAALIRPIFMASVSKNSKSPEAAIKFMNWFLNDAEAGAILGSSNGTPASSVHQEAAEKSGALEPLMLKGIEYGTQSAAARENANSTNSELDQIMLDVISEVAMGKTAPAEAVTKTISIVDKKCADFR